MTTEKPLVELTTTENRHAEPRGRVCFARCGVCARQTPAVPGKDDLRVLAAAKADGWTFAVGADGTFRLKCAYCTRRGL